MFVIDDAAGREFVTQRLRLRPARRRDVADLHEAIVETLPELTRWLPWATPDHSTVDTRRYLRGARTAWSRRVALELIVEEIESGRILGITSVHRIDWIRRSAGLGYWIRASAQGRGLATEAAAATVTHAFERLSLHRLEAHVAPENKRSQRVAEKLGFLREGIARQSELVEGRYLDHIQYGLLRTDPSGCRGSAP